MAARFRESALASVLRQVDELHLRPDSDAVWEAERRADRLVEELHWGRAWMFQVVATHPHGSLSRGTGLRRFKDLDRLVELDGEALRTWAGARRTARDTITRMARHIRARRAGLVTLGSIRVRAQAHSVGVRYPGSGLTIDLVPAIRSRGRLYIPERDTGLWLQTDPVRTAARLETARAIAPDAEVVVRLLKGWARARGRNAPIRSFAVETLVVNAMLEQPVALDKAVVGFFGKFAEAHAGRRMALGDEEPEGPVTLIEPVSGNNLTAKLSGAHRSTLVNTCRATLWALGQVEALAREGRRSQALTAARRLFVGIWG